MPGSWGLRGKVREQAKIEYYYDGEEKERKLIDLLYTDEKTKELENLKLDLKYGKISEYEYEKKEIEITNKDDNLKYKLNLLDLKLKYNKISKYDYEREKSNLLKKPWVSVSPDSFYNPENGKDGFMLSLDYNEYFIEMLKENGYKGRTNNEIIDEWFKDVMLSILLEEKEEEINDLTLTKIKPLKTERKKIKTDFGKKEIYS